MTAELFDFIGIVERERRRRIQVAVWAYAYEYLNESLVSDAQFDATCLAIDVNIPTNRRDLDDWYRANFHPCTGQWIYQHPERERLEQIARWLIDANHSRKNIQPCAISEIDPSPV